jgi:hypothetical protein
MKQVLVTVAPLNWNPRFSKFLSFGEIEPVFFQLMQAHNRGYFH